MDKRACSVCRAEFDLDTAGLQGPGEVVVCGAACAKKSAEGRGNKYAIHDSTGKMTETDVQPGDVIGQHNW